MKVKDFQKIAEEQNAEYELDGKWTIPDDIFTHMFEAPDIIGGYGDERIDGLHADQMIIDEIDAHRHERVFTMEPPRPLTHPGVRPMATAAEAIEEQQRRAEFYHRRDYYHGQIRAINANRIFQEIGQIGRR